MLCYSLRETTPKSTEDVEEREGTSSVESQSRSGFTSDQRGPLDRAAMGLDRMRFKCTCERVYIVLTETLRFRGKTTKSAQDGRKPRS